MEGAGEIGRRQSGFALHIPPKMMVQVMGDCWDLEDSCGLEAGGNSIERIPLDSMNVDAQLIFTVIILEDDRKAASQSGHGWRAQAGRRVRTANKVPHVYCSQLRTVLGLCRWLCRDYPWRQ